MDIEVLRLDCPAVWLGQVREPRAIVGPADRDRAAWNSREACSGLEVKNLHASVALRHRELTTLGQLRAAGVDGGALSLFGLGKAPGRSCAVAVYVWIVAAAGHVPVAQAIEAY